MLGWIIALILVALVAASSVFIGWKIASMTLHPKIYDYNTVVDEEIKRGNYTREWYDQNVRLQEFFIRSPYGYDLHCALWPRKEDAAFPDGRRRVAVFVHGYTYCLLGGIKYASIFHELGFDCVLYDHRNHGLSGKAPTTMGAYEARDLAAVCAWARGRFGEDAALGTHGESMGAATVMIHAGLDDRLAFAIEDCGFTDWKSELKFALPHRFHLPPYPSLWFAMLFFRLRGGVTRRDRSPKESLKHALSVPMLFLHGDADELVPYFMMEQNARAKAGVRETVAFAGAKHAACYRTNPVAYRDRVTKFLRENGAL